MRKQILTLAALLLGGAAFAEAPVETPAHYSLYGFVRNYAVFDSREVNAGTEDLYFYMPKDIAGDPDANANPSFRMLALTTRLGLKIAGYQYGDMHVSGAVETDFYCMNGSVATLRLRQAYVNLAWDEINVNVGQTWHPMAADMPHITNLETGAPFNPFNRSPQIMANWHVGGGLTFTGGIIYGMQYLPTGPSGKTEAYMKYGLLPEIYLGLGYKSGPFVGKAGVDMMSIVPSKTATLGDGSVRTVRRNTMISPFVYLQYTHGLFQIRAKSILAQGGEHMNLLSGYGLSAVQKDGCYAYTPMRDWASFISFNYGKKVQFLGMLGYMKQLGTTADLYTDDAGAQPYLWINTSADTKINQAVRFTPTLAWNLGKVTLSLEYNLTAAQFGEGARNSRGLYTAGHWVLNHRVEQMVKFNF